MSTHDMTIGDEIEERYIKEIAAWSIEHNCFREDWTRAQWQRYQTWIYANHDLARAQREWLKRARASFARWQVRQGKIGQDDQAADPETVGWIAEAAS